MMAPWLSALVDHLWQSTLFASVIWLATLAVRRNSARVRYGLWMAASVKFLVPFSALVSLGALVEWRTAAPVAQPAVSFVMHEIFVAPLRTASALPSPSAPVLAPWVLLGLWLAGSVAVLVSWRRQWMPIRAALAGATAVHLGSPYHVRDIDVWSSPSMLEPAVIGIRRPVLLVPEALINRLSPAQMNALIAHERCHIRCHDNLVAALHMGIEAIFWFHPLVWWIEKRMIDERERACDEAVLRSGSQPADYAEGILTVCRFAVQAPLACAAGISGSDLRRRIEAILGGGPSQPMSTGRGLALAFTAAAAIGLPVVAGAVNAVPLITVGQDPATPVAFDVASVKVNKSGERGGLTNDSVPGTFTATNVWVGLLIQYAYDIEPNQLDAPAWTRTLAPERFDVTARLAQAPLGLSQDQAMPLAMRTLLAERFNLVVRRETREVPMFALVMARRDRQPGPMLKRSATDCSEEARAARMAAAQAGKPVGMCGLRTNTGRLQFGGYPMSWFAKNFSYGGRSVIDRTGLTGAWEFAVTFMPDQLGPSPGPNPPPIDADAPSLETVLREQLGLKLEPTKGLMEFLVVDRVERPTEN